MFSDYDDDYSFDDDLDYGSNSETSETPQVQTPYVYVLSVCYQCVISVLYPATAKNPAYRKSSLISKLLN